MDTPTKTCPYCIRTIPSQDTQCRHCGQFLTGSPVRQSYQGYEYRSQAELLGLPLVHISFATNPETGRVKVAKGIIAIGSVAIGLLALGGVALGGLTLGGVSLGLIALGGVALGGATFGGLSLVLWIAVGGLSVAGWLAVGGVAISLKYAIGGVAVAPHTISGLGADPELLKLLGM